MRSSFPPRPPTSLRTPLRTSLAALAIAGFLSACGGEGGNRPPVEIIGEAVPPLSPAVLARIDDYAQAQMRRQHIPGMTLVVTRGGQPVLKKGYGVANMTTGAPATPDTVYRIASLTKQFTASAIMVLVQEGRLTLDQPVSSFFATTPASWKDITVRHLLNHTSGLRRDLSPALLDRVDPHKLPPIDQQIALAGEAPLQAPTGAAYGYSNVGYHVLGFVIEKVTGQHYASFMQQRFFGPLGMRSADVIRTTRAAPSMAAGYTWDGEAIRPAAALTMMPGLIEAEGGLQMSALDLAKWEAAIAGERFLSKAGLAQMWAPSRLTGGSAVPYGLGWALDTVNARPFMHHSGQLEGFTSQFARHPGEDFSVIVMTNTDSAITGRMASRISAIVDPRLDWVIAADPRPQTGALLRTVMDEAARGVLRADERFAPAFQAELPPEVLTMFTEFMRQHGTITQLGFIDYADLNGMQVARYLVRAGAEQSVLGIALDAQGRILFVGLMDG